MSTVLCACFMCVFKNNFIQYTVSDLKKRLHVVTFLSYYKMLTKLTAYLNLSLVC